MFIKFTKDENNNYLLEFCYRCVAEDGFTELPYRYGPSIESLHKEGKLLCLEENGEIVTDCFELKDVAQHVRNNAILQVLMKDGEYHDEENNRHLKLIHPSIREIKDETSTTPKDFNFDFLDKNDIDQPDDGWEGSCKVNGLDPKLGFREAVISSMADNGYIEKEEQMQAIDDWHYQITGEMRLWKNKEQLLTDKINAALAEAGWNVIVKVQFAPKDDDSFIIDLSEHSFPPYYLMYSTDPDFDRYGENLEVSRDPDKFYLKAIEIIFDATKYSDVRAKWISKMLEEGYFTYYYDENDDYSDLDMDICMAEIHPQLLLQEGTVEADDYIIADQNEISYISLPKSDDYEDEDEYEEAFEEFCCNIADECHRIFFIKFV